VGFLLAILRAIPALRGLADTIEKVFRRAEAQKRREDKLTILTRLLLMQSLILVSGCVVTKLDTSRSLIETHPKGFKDAVNASPEARLFVKDAENKNGITKQTK